MKKTIGSLAAGACLSLVLVVPAYANVGTNAASTIPPTPTPYNTYSTTGTNGFGPGGYSMYGSGPNGTGMYNTNGTYGTTGTGVYNTYNTNGTGVYNGRTNYTTNNPSAYRAYNTRTDGVYRTRATTTGRSWGWLGLFGLIGLAGMFSGNRQRDPER